MEEVDKGCLMIRMGVSGRMFLLVPAYPGSPRSKTVKLLCMCVALADGNCHSQTREKMLQFSTVLSHHCHCTIQTYHHKDKQ